MLGLKETIDHLAMASCVRWYGHVFRREDGHDLRRALDIEVEGQRKRMWKKQVEGESMKVCLRRKGALCRSMWSVGVSKMAAVLRGTWQPSPVGGTTRFRYWCLYVCASLQLFNAITLIIYLCIFH